MFTGIVEAVGTVQGIEPMGEISKIRFSHPAAWGALPAGASVAVNGCCLTAVDVNVGQFSAELTPETLARTSFSQQLRTGFLVNLERPLRADGRFEGHVVQGHIDGVGTVVARESEGRSARVSIRLPPELSRYVVSKGSIAIDGVSLTVAEIREDVFVVALIPYTLEQTTLQALQPGQLVNIEVDLVAKYVERLLGADGAR